MITDINTLDGTSRSATISTTKLQRDSHRDVQRLATLAGYAVSAIGAADLYGWWWEIEWLTRVVPSWPPMVANTALMLMLAGASLVALNKSPRAHVRRYLGISAAMIVELIAVLTLAEYLFNWDAAIDQLLVQTQASGSGIPGRPSLPTALTLALLSAALLFLDRGAPRGLRWSEVLCFSALWIPMLALLGYVYRVSELYGFPALLPHTGVAVHTALALMLLGAGILAARPGTGFMSVLTSGYAAGGATRRVLATFVVFPVQAAAIGVGAYCDWYPDAVGTAGIVFIGLLDGFLLLLLTGSYVHRKETALRDALQESARLRTELETVTSAISVVSDAVADLPATDLVKVLDTVARAAQGLTGAHYVALGVGTDPQKPLHPWIAIGMGAEQAFGIGRAPRPVGLLGAVAREGQVFRIPDVRARRDLTDFPISPNPGALLAVPIRYRRRAVGSLFLTKQAGAPEFTEQDQRRVLMLADKAGAAIEIATHYTSEAQQRLWLRTIIDQMPEAVVVLDRKQTFGLHNRAAQALNVNTGRFDPRGEPQSLDVRYASGQPVPGAELPIERALLHGERVLGAELAIVGPNQRWIPIVASATPVLIDGEIAGAVAVFQDISQLKELERQREEWTSIVAHDLRQPVNTIALALEALIAGYPAGTKEDSAIERIRGAVQGLGRMIGDLLDASRLESQRLEIEREPVDVRSMLEEVWTTVGELRDRHVRLNVPASTPRVFADQVRLGQILRNLLSNAGKYGSPGTEVEIGATCHDDAVEITIKNRGCGIASEDLPRLFQRFGRSTSSKRAGISGIGLGLYITKGLVEAHGGRVWAESAPGEITCFHFTIPVAKIWPERQHASRFSEPQHPAAPV